MKTKKIVVIGGGASGIIAALSAKTEKNEVIILEKNNRIGKKILVTGNGRCNYTNITLTELDYNHPNFVKNIFSQFSVNETLDFFEQMGIIAKIEEEGKAFPLSEQASSFLDVFLYELEKRQIKLVTNFDVNKIVKRKETFQIISKDKNIINADKVIIATGGKAMPLTGSDGSGYDIACSFGHKLIDVFPALVKLKLDSPYLKQLSGVKINSQVDLMVDGKVEQTQNGDILFTNYGISGPTILELSKRANELLLENKDVKLRVILVQSVPKAKIINRIFNSLGNPIDQTLIGLVNKRFINVLIKEANIDKNNTLVKNLDKSQIYNLVNLLYDIKFKVIGSLGFEEAQVTSGGIDTNEINSSTMESKIVKGMYFSGEVIDIDARCGGYNLQWAWSSGYIAGENARESAEND
ncbi:MAG: NAD(P)/FAD-dependent oxidoreductase [Candidatus Izemoplasmatales bacterium]